MANRTFYPRRSYGFDLVDLDFSFTTNGSSDPTASTIVGTNGTVLTIAHKATGKYTVTMGAQDTYKNVAYAEAGIDDASGATNPLTATIGNFTNLGTSSQVTFDVYTRNNGTKSDLTSNVVRVHVTFVNTTSGMQ